MCIPHSSDKITQPNVMSSDLVMIPPDWLSICSFVMLREPAEVV